MALPSPSNACPKCGEAVSPALITCPKCQALQPFPSESPSFYEVLGVSPALTFEEGALRSRFYALSRACHPDKFASGGGLEAVHAARWATLVNRAFQTLREPEAAREHFLTWLGGAPKASSIPVDFAEKYFELQELLEDGDNQDGLVAFLAELQAFEKKSTNDWETLARSWDEKTVDKAAFAKKVSLLLNHERTIRSCIRDLKQTLEKLK